MCPAYSSSQNFIFINWIKAEERHVGIIVLHSVGVAAGAAKEMSCGLSVVLHHIVWWVRQGPQALIDVAVDGSIPRHAYVFQLHQLRYCIFGKKKSLLMMKPQKIEFKPLCLPITLVKST